MFRTVLCQKTLLYSTCAGDISRFFKKLKSSEARYPPAVRPPWSKTVQKRKTPPRRKFRPAGQFRPFRPFRPRWPKSGPDGRKVASRRPLQAPRIGPDLGLLEASGGHFSGSEATFRQFGLFSLLLCCFWPNWRFSGISVFFRVFSTFHHVYVIDFKMTR